MSIFDEDSNLKNLETIALYKQIRAIIDWVHTNLDNYYRPILMDDNVMSILEKHQYDSSAIPDNELSFYDKWGKILNGKHDPILCECNYKFEMLSIDEFKEDPLDSELNKITFIFSKIELVIINGEVYIHCVGNNIIHMRYFTQIPDFIKFIGDPYIVITSKIDENKIRRYRCDCKFIIFDENYPLNNFTEEKHIDRVRNSIYVNDSDTNHSILNDGKWIMKVDYSKEMDYGTVQNVCSKTIGWGLSPIQV